MMTRLSEWLLTHRILGWLIVGAISAASVAGLFRLEFDDDLRSAFRPVETVASVRASDNNFLCLVSGENLFEAPVLDELREFDYRLREVAGIAKVSSIFDLRSRKAIEGYRPPLMPSSEADAASLAALQEELDEHPLARGFLLGRSENVLLFAADPGPEIRQVDQLSPIKEEIEGLLSDLSRRTGLVSELTGVPVLRIRIVETTRREQMIFSAGGAVLGILIAFLIFRRLAVLPIIFPVPQIAAGWTMGAMGLVGEPINVMNNMISLLITVITLTNTTHLIFTIRRHAAAGKSPGAAASAGLSEVGGACFMTSLTTAIAFASLAFSSNSLVSRYGLACACGTMLAFLAVVLLVPLLAATPLGKHLLPRNAGMVSRAQPMFEKIAFMVSAHPRRISIICVLVILLCGGACFKLDFDYRYRENLDTASKDFQVIDTLDREFGGSQPLSIVVTWPEGKTADEAGLCQFLREVHDVIEIPQWTGHPFSIQSLVDAIGQEDTASPVQSLVTLSPEGELDTLLDEQNHTALITLPLRDAGASVLSPVLDEVERRLKRIESKHPGYEIRMTGLTATSIRSSRLMIRELSVGLFSAALVIFVVIGLSLRSVELGLKSILPNLLPMVVSGAGLVIFGLPLQYTSALALTLCLGVAVDDTIHFLYRFRENRAHGLDPEAAVAEALITVGASLLTSTAILIAGFAVLQFSELPSIRLFSGLAMLTLMTALLADLFILPALLLIRRTKSAVSEPNGAET